MIGGSMLAMKRSIISETDLVRCLPFLVLRFLKITVDWISGGGSHLEGRSLGVHIIG